ncbi:MAG: peptidylprolyl isomerase [Candidatus Krumholzibacteria bacterium]|nr:peptidylprolyl isomerase [Candidatus Krumholzibacteria bacterium]
MADTRVTLKTNRGDIVLKFFPDTAPEHVKNFLEHTRSGYYTGCTFHRVIPGFMIQGGDPNTKPGASGAPGTGGYSYRGEGTQLEAEFNERLHKRGILSMARAQDPNSAGSQFFIMHDDAPFLDGQYTVFGEVVSGLEAVDAIVSSDRDPGDKPLEDQRIEDVTVEE